MVSLEWAGEEILAYWIPERRLYLRTRDGLLDLVEAGSS